MVKPDPQSSAVNTGKWREGPGIFVTLMSDLLSFCCFSLSTFISLLLSQIFQKVVKHHSYTLVS